MDWVAKWWLEALFGVVLAALGAAYRFLTKRVKEDREQHKQHAMEQEQLIQELRDGNQALLRDRLIQQYNYYGHQKGKCPIYARENIASMHKAYSALGGNGMINDLVEDIWDLPTETKNEGGTI